MTTGNGGGSGLAVLMVMQSFSFQSVPTFVDLLPPSCQFSSVERVVDKLAGRAEERGEDGTAAEISRSFNIAGAALRLIRPVSFGLHRVLSF